ncbi:MAG TPA: bifunctional diaminohydroxyphosphoribosylaminopyrimidine deaminase/5-amino-6-(5-phosphoribosylamino)uracil reductase RibD [Synergistaceae bacterium]|nr:bifunctional diaminohydroxyphosphoribosylaminopyrimidine deaminase/5-amino-6-(5-phosphoribosylamino)uracil reductase RibD [Synergistaceae bacterium]HPJ25919.1 bifunctional diaminohydroxyphosphoribosylaminopyrimidine deaminase/5-amino-6-(5-phosphoribosylamino)uracil reductase RibD [Synergistaceae bacterium]HPQ36079.1 bifunctional diaminohydroxyphosphoribosylaminopyrimidine deaminase/5-amino-6-(5-phosphoribosylamino)uracil reductase RibD [Synergistaceae bacterium]
MTREERQQDKYYMHMALSLARRGMGYTSPNPLVGCVLVKDSEVVGMGWHRRYGGPHAEVEALGNAGSAARGSTAYVTLEPCSHYGKTPPCAPRLVKEGIARVVIGSRDPNPKVAGGGVAILEEAGIPVISGVLEKECRDLNRGFFSWHLRGRSWVRLKGALSLDGKLALPDGTSKWITGSRAREMAHLLRGEHDAILVGAGTVRCDDPRLTVRSVAGVSPVPVVIDPKLSLSPTSVLFERERVILACNGAFGSSEEGKSRKKTFPGGVEFVELPEIAPGELNCEVLLQKLGALGLLSVLLEGGSRVASSFLGQKLVDRVALFYGARILGAGLSLAENLCFRSMDEVITLSSLEYRSMEEGFLVEGVPSCSPDW